MSTDQQFLLTLNAITIILFVYFSLIVFPRRPLSRETRDRHRTFISNALFREFWLFVTKPVKGFLSRNQISANGVTLAGVVLSGIAGAGYALELFGFAGWVLIVAATCDMIDGQLARERGQMTKSGAFFDSTLDRVGEFLIAAGLVWLFRHDPLWLMVTFLFAGAAQLTSYTRARAEGLGFSGRDGLFQRPERLIVLCIATPLVPILDIVGLPGVWLLQAALVVCAVGSTITAFERWLSAYREIKEAE